MKEDRELLRQFEAEGSHEAFEEIVSRHLDLVYSVAMRQVAGDAHLAKDVCQEVFVSLARKAAKLSGRSVVSGWLYRAARFEASRAVRNEVLRRTREREAGMEQDLDETELQIDWEQARPLLDEAIAALGESERDAICLRFYESRQYKEIGERLDVSENTARMRVNRSLDKLRDMLKRKGIQSSAATLAVALGGQATLAAPVGLAQTIAAGSVAAMGSGLLASVIGIMNTTKVIGLGVVSVATVGSVVYFVQDDETPDIENGQPVEVIASESPPESIASQTAAENDPSETAEFVDPLETDEERHARRIAELDRLKEEEAISDIEYKLRAALLNNEIEISRKKENPSGPPLTPEERIVFDQFIELRKTDKEAADELLIGSMDESSSRAMFFMAGSVYGEGGDSDLAIDFFKTGIERAGGQDRNLDRRINRNLGIMLVQKSEFDEAKRYMQQALYLSDKPDNTLHGLYGLAELNSGNHAAAEYHYKQAFELNPEVNDWGLGLTRVYMEQEKYQKANEVIEAMLERIAKE